ncbi:MAG: TetR/AcrR family transcriptional regulator [Telmatospirillum sp.]|nr:TetR/AcrR family transcriptional regulator [Telmatospirillum sp.]
MNEQLQKVRGQPARRKEIIDAARALAAEEGWPAVTLRAIAARIGCSAPAIYQYFQDKDALLSALAATGREEMNRALEAAATGDHGPAKRLRAMLRALWDFSIDNRELFAVMVGIDGLAAHRDAAGGGGAPPPPRPDPRSGRIAVQT